MKWSADHLRALVAAALLAAVMAWLIGDRFAFLQGAAVTGTVIAHDVRESGKRTGSGSLRQGTIRTSRYPIVGYGIPATSPQRAGEKAEYTFSLPADLPLGTPVPLRLAPHDPGHARVDSVLGIWGVPLLVCFLGSVALWSIAHFVPVPGPPTPRVRRSGPLWTFRQLYIALAVLGVLVTACFLLSPFLVWGLPVMMLCAWGLGVTVRKLCTWGLRVFRGPVPGRDRPGAAGLLVDLLEHSARLVVIGGLFAVSLAVSLAGVDASFPRHAGSWTWLNSVRSLAWQPYDYSAAMSRAARDGELDAARWLAPRTPVAYLGPATAIALAADHDDLVRLLLAHGADPNVRLPHADPMLLYAIRNHRDPAQIEALLKAGADPNLRLPDGLTITDRLQTLDRIDRTLDLLPLLARHGANLDHRDGRGRTVLMRASAAADRRQQRLVSLLLELGADPNVAAADGRTALDLAQTSGAPATVQRLLAHGARSGRLVPGPGVHAVSREAPAAEAAGLLLERLRSTAVAHWRPTIRSLDLSESEAEKLRAALPHTDWEVAGWQTADRASLQVCGTADQGRRCIGMELVRRVPKQAVEVSAAAEAAVPVWEVLSYWLEPDALP